VKGTSPTRIEFEGSDEPLGEVVRKPEFRIERCRKVRKNGDELVEVAFSHRKSERNAERSLSGTLLFDPRRFWCLRSAFIQRTGEPAGSQTVRVTQSENAGGDPPLSRVWQSDEEVITKAVRSQVTRRSE
jgi:hypothetical protein